MYISSLTGPPPELMLETGDLARVSAVRSTSIAFAALLLQSVSVCLDIFTTRPIATKGLSKTAPLRAARRTIIFEPVAAARDHSGRTTRSSNAHLSAPRPAPAADADQDAESRAPSAGHRTGRSNSPLIRRDASPTPRRGGGSSRSMDPSAHTAASGSRRRR